MSPAEFEDVVAEVWLPVQRYLRRRVDPTTAEDVLADVLLVMWRRRADLPVDAALPWCYGVARGCLSNAVRGERRRLRLIDRLVAEPAVTLPAEDEALNEAISRLRAGDRELLRLWAWEGLAPREIALVLDITPNAASIRLHRATARLRELVRKTSAPAGHRTQRQGEEAPQ